MILFYGLLQSVVGGSAVNQQQTLSEFLLSLYDGLSSIKDVLSEIGVRTLSATQLTCLSELPLANLYHCLKMFANWMEEGIYDFATLPYTIKAHLRPEDLSTLIAIPRIWEGINLAYLCSSFCNFIIFIIISGALYTYTCMTSVM